jgi:REP element-mobilizing transposase RayT
MVVSALRAGDLEFHRYDLPAFVVMSNHVHILVTPRVIDTHWLGPLKGFTAHQGNKLLGLHGRAFWQDESYDHLVRTGEEYRRIRSYIECNPVKAGIVACATEFRWSSARTAA